MKYTEKNILEALRLRFLSSEYCLENSYIFRHNWESDMFVLQKSGYCYEIEVKTSKSDFKADFKKEQKHSILQTGSHSYLSNVWKGYDENLESIYKEEEVTINHDFRPNRFYYCVPEGLIALEEIPKYAGLIYVTLEGPNRKVDIVKQAPLLHKTKLDLYKVLCKKFYFKWRNLVQTNLINEYKNSLD